MSCSRSVSVDWALIQSSMKASMSVMILVSMSGELLVRKGGLSGGVWVN